MQKHIKTKAFNSSLGKRKFWIGFVWLCLSAYIASTATAQQLEYDDMCPSLERRGIFCTNTPTMVGDWTYSVSSSSMNWRPSPLQTFTSAESLVGVWTQDMHAARLRGALSCETGTLTKLRELQPPTERIQGYFELGTFPERLHNLSYQLSITCIEPYFNNTTVQRTDTVGLMIQADRVVNCAPPQRKNSGPGYGYCIGEVRPAFVLKDLGREEKEFRGSPRIIEATVTNAANNNAIMRGVTFSMRVSTPDGRGQIGRLLNTSYPRQNEPGSSIMAVTDDDGKSVSRFFWPGSVKDALVQRIGADCDPSGACSSTLDVRWNPDIVIGFFNGVANTRAAAQKSMDRLEVEFGPQYKDTPITYDWFYNQTACGEGVSGKVACLEDVAEVFEQRSLELGGVFADRWETFWDILAGRHQVETSFTGRLVNLLGNGSNALLQWLDASANALINQLARDTLKLLTLPADSPTTGNRSTHLEKLMRHADEGRHLLLIAHSQGNLFANSAYDAIKMSRPQTPAQVVHVAPASPTLRGAHVLADIDLVINALRLSGLNSVPDVNIALPSSKSDPSGHGFEPTYLDKSRAAYSRTIGMITASLEALTQ